MDSSHDLGKVYFSNKTLQEALGCSYVTAKSILDDAEKVGDVLTFDGKKLYNRAAVAIVIRERNKKVLDFLAGVES